MRKQLHEKLVQSPRFAPGKSPKADDDEDKQNSDEPLTNILSKEEDHARRIAQDKSVSQINKHREEINKGLTELINKYEGRQKELQEELS